MPTIEGNYQKRIGLPGFSSHSFSLTVRVDLDDTANIDRESAKLYSVLQNSVDREIQEVGFVPETSGDGTPPAPSRSNANSGVGNYRSNGGAYPSNGRSSAPSRDYWKCSDKQRDLINKVIRDNQLDERDIEDWAQDMFQKDLKQLNKMEMSGLIQVILDKYGDKPNGNGNRNGGRPNSYQRGGNRR